MTPYGVVLRIVIAKLDELFACTLPIVEMLLEETAFNSCPEVRANKLTVNVFCIVI